MIPISLLFVVAITSAASAAAESPGSVTIDLSSVEGGSDARGSITVSFLERNLERPAGGFLLELADPEGSAVGRYPVPAGGEISLRDLPAGDWYLSADLGGGEPFRKRVRVREGPEPREYEFNVDLAGVSFQTVIPSSADRSLQPCGVYIPARFDRRNSYPLVVALHGTPGTVTGSLEDLGMPLPGDLGEVFIIAPYGHGNSGFDGIGETDIGDALALILDRFPIDRDRLYLVGHSMGASAAFRIATLRPHVFGAAAFVEPVIDPSLAGDVPPYVEQLFRESFPLECIANLRGTPTWWVHAASDEIVPVDHSRRAVTALRELGATVRYHELPLRHAPEWIDALADRELVRWLLTQKRAVPSGVVFRTPTIRYPEDRWVEISRFGRDAQSATVEAQIEAENQVGVYTEGVGALFLDLSMLSLDRRKEVEVFANNFPVYENRVPREGRLAVQIEEPLVGPRKTRTLCGPWRQAFAAPFLYVVGDEAERRALSDAIADLSTEESFFLPPGPVRFASEITEKERDGVNLICFGSPGSNPILDEALAASPIRVDGPRVRLGSILVGGDDLSLHFVYPSPYSPARLVQVNLSLHGGIPLDFQAARYHIPDFIVLDAEGRSDPTGWRAPAAGWFTSEWTLDEDAVYLREQPHQE